MTTPISHEQRDAFARLLRDAKERQNILFKERLEEKVKDEFLPKLVRRQGIAALVDKVGKLAGELTESARVLQSVDVVGRPEGFFGSLLKPEDVNDVLERMKKPHLDENKRSMREFDLAALQIMSAQSVEEAREIVEALI